MVGDSVTWRVLSPRGGDHMKRPDLLNTFIRLNSLVTKDRGVVASDGPVSKMLTAIFTNKPDPMSSYSHPSSPSFKVERMLSLLSNYCLRTRIRNLSLRRGYWVLQKPGAGVTFKSVLHGRPITQRQYSEAEYYYQAILEPWPCPETRLMALVRTAATFLQVTDT